MTTATRPQRPVAAWAVKAARDWAEIDRNELAARLTELDPSEKDGWNYNKIRRLETGEREVPARIINALAEITGMSVSFFITAPNSQRGWLGHADADPGDAPFTLDQPEPAASSAVLVGV